MSALDSYSRRVSRDRTYSGKNVAINVNATGSTRLGVPAVSKQVKT